MTDIRLVAYAPNGAKLGPLPTPEEASASFPLNDLGAVSLKYPPVGARTDLLGQPMEVAVEVSWDLGVTWQEPPAGRFLYLRDGRDPVKDDSYSAECPAYVTRLEKGLVDATGLDADGKRSFTDASPGAILVPLLQEAQTRGALTGLSWAFTAAVDSSGAAWPVELQQSVSYDPGTSILAILLGMAEAGLVDFRTNGRALEVFAAESANGMGADRTTGANPVTLRPGRDITEAPFRRTWEALADTALVQGDAGTYITRTNGAALTPWGRQETFITASGVTDTGTLAVLADAQLSLTADQRAEFTVGLDFSAAVQLPLRDYSPGEWVNRATDLGALERVRVRQLTLTLDNQGRSGGNAVLNDRFLEQEVKTQRRVASISGGGTAATPGTPSPAGNDILAPAQVTGLDHTTSAYIDRRVPQAQVTLSWLAVTTNADGSPISDLQGYEVWRRNVLEGPTAWVQVATVPGNSTSWSDSPYEPGGQWEFRVRAVDNSLNWGAFSDLESVTMATDITAPPTPSAPVLGTRNGILEASWDGKDDTLAAMPGDVERVELHRSQDPAFVPVPGDVDTLVGSFYGPGVLIVSSLLTGGDSWSARLVAVDYAGNASAPSDVDTITVDPLQVAEPPAPPDDSPTVTLTPLGVGALLARWPSVTGADDYALYVDDAPIVALDATKLHGLTGGGTSSAIQRLPRTGAMLQAGTTYYARVLARNESGGAVAGLGTEATGSPRQATTEDISAAYVYGGTVEASQVKTGDLEADLALVGDLTAGDPAGRRIQLGPDGFRQYDGTGQLIVDFPTAPDGVNTIRAELVTQGLTTEGRAQFRGKDNEISRDSQLTLASGVTDPANSPTVQDYLPTAKDDTGADLAFDPGSTTLMANPDYSNFQGFTWYPGGGVFVWLRKATVNGVKRTYLVKWNPTTKAVTSTLVQGTASPRIPAGQIPAGYTDPDAHGNQATPLDERYGFATGAVVGDFLYCLVSRNLYRTDTLANYFTMEHAFWYVYRVNLTNGAQDGSWCWRWTDPLSDNWVDGAGYFGTGDYSSRNLPAIGSSADHASIWLAQVHPTTGQPRLWKKDPASGANQVAAMDANVTAPNLTDRVAALLHRNVDVGERLVVKLGTGTTVHHLNPANAQTYGSGEQWLAGSGAATLGYDGTRFYSAAGLYDGAVQVHSTSVDTTPTHWAYTWYDPDPGGTGTHETSISPAATITPRKRWGVQATVPTVPPVVAGDPDSPSEWRMYAATGATPPGPSSMNLQARTAVTAYGSTYYYAYTGGTGRPVTGTATAPTDNTFPDGYSGELRSGIGGFILRGDGTGEWPYIRDAITNPLDARLDVVERTDQAAATASLRTLGAGALQAAPGNHGHGGITRYGHRRWSDNGGWAGGVPVGMSSFVQVTIPSAAFDRMAYVSFFCLYNGTHPMRYCVTQNGNVAWPHADNYPTSNAPSGTTNNAWTLEGSNIPINFGPNQSYVVAVCMEAHDSTAGITLKEYHIVVDVVNAPNIADDADFSHRWVI